MCKIMDKKCYTAQEAESFAFFRIPKALMTNPKYEALSYGAKFLYGLLFDRMSLSVKNGWFDEAGEVFIYFTIEEIIKTMCCCSRTAMGFLEELEGAIL